MSHMQDLLQILSQSSPETLQRVANFVLPRLKRDFLAHLPVEIAILILEYLNLASLSKCARVSRPWHKLISSPQVDCAIWKFKLDQEKWPRPKSSQVSFKNAYKSHFVLRRNWFTNTYKHVEFPAHEFNVVTSLQIDDEKIVSGSDDATIKLFDFDGNLLGKLTGHEGGVWALHYINNTLVSGSTDRTVRVWNMKTAVCTHVFDDQPIIITGSRDSSLRIWKLPDPEKDARYYPTGDQSNHSNPYLLHILNGHCSSVRSIAADANILISGSYDMTVRVWDIVQGKCLHVLRGHREKVYSVGYSHHLQRCASGSLDTTVKVWDTVHGELLYNLEGHGSLVGLIDLSDRYLVSAGADGSLKVWCPVTGASLGNLVGHTAPITCFDYRDNLNRFVSGSDGGVKVWELSSFAYPHPEELPHRHPWYVSAPSGMQPYYGRMLFEELHDCNGVWRVVMDERRLVCAVQKSEQGTFFQVFDFGIDRDEQGFVRGIGDVEDPEPGDEADNMQGDMDFMDHEPMNDNNNNQQQPMNHNHQMNDNINNQSNQSTHAPLLPPLFPSHLAHQALLSHNPDQNMQANDAYERESGLRDVQLNTQQLSFEFQADESEYQQGEMRRRSRRLLRLGPF